jgi:PIN domain nuclease of toxin-antitoxin system
MHVLDASAVLALLYSEPGAEEVLSRIDGSIMSSVNLAEVLQKASQVGQDPHEISDLLKTLVAGIVPFDDVMAAETAALWRSTKHAGLSLGDRACISLSIAMNGIALTADKAWGTIEVPGLNVHVIRR